MVVHIQQGNPERDCKHGAAGSRAGPANNVLDKQWPNEVIPAIELGGSFISPGAYRVIGVELGLRF